MELSYFVSNGKTEMDCNTIKTAIYIIIYTIIHPYIYLYILYIKILGCGFELLYLLYQDLIVLAIKLLYR